MNMLTWLVRAKRWAQRPPSEKRVKFVLAIIAGCILLFLIERYFGWPDALTPNRIGRSPKL
ncbi:hypothetical protein [Palleronia caenipelagi]|uniref:Uncharacterized protein n=1 Tax=Palleronia caenipelagi TaxID=2489174 RepID=A0A547PNL5_9RHOB|nr:hypothetical protein [Palleronia caenipelagi]TRD15715.1 hypothetical protein FEV53_15275 [Palleronia caenipelagi]